MSNDSIKKTVLVVLGVCLVCSLLVSTAAVKLFPLQEENRKLDKVKNILVAGELFSEGTDIAKTYDEKIEPVLIELATGESVSEENFDDVLNEENFDITVLANHPKYGRSIPQPQDLANIKVSPKYMLVYFVKEGEEIKRIILPVYGKGLWSTMYAFLALDKDLKTVTGVTFYEHGETPGLGGEIENPRWNNLWKGKEAFDENNNVQLEIIKGIVNRTRPEANYQIDGLSGATITARGVDKMIKFWLGDNGYALFLNKLREEM
ncbi:MAG: Na(+)-translocating NADH-quinone reductase subunit C [Ignavibacteriaceae bacterium]